MQLLTDGSVLVSQDNTGVWEKLTPSSTGSYVNGTWSQIASMPSGYAPLYFASAVLPDGRMIIEGGEYNGSSTEVWTTLGAIYNPVSNSWTPVSPPSGWAYVGDAQSEVLPNGTFMMANIVNGQAALLNSSSLTWTPTGTGKADRFDEEGWTLLPNGKILTVDTQNGTNTEVYDPATGVWSSAGNTPFSLVDNVNDEIGPLPGTPKSSSVLAVGANGANAYYQNSTWHSAPSLPNIGGQQYDTADGPAATLPNGQILVAASPGYGGTPTHFFLYDPSVNAFTQIADTPDAFEDSSYFLRMIVLPTGQVMEDDSGEVQIYTPAASAQAAWKPSITSAPATVAPSLTYPLSGTQLNGLDQGASYGDDAQANTNYPLVRITNATTKTVTYARTTGMSSLGIGSGSASSTNFAMPAGTPPGPGSLVTVANGIPSAAASATVPVEVLDSGFSPALAKLNYGLALTWSLDFPATASHTVTDNSGLGLFNHNLPPGGTFSFTFPAAGTYSVIDLGTSKTSKVSIPPTAAPTKGTTATSFTIQWASNPLPSGDEELLYVKRPGTTTYSLIATTTATSKTFTPDAGPGVYSFGTRLKNISSHHVTSQSPAASITVS